jgi:hypothetical protein
LSNEAARANAHGATEVSNASINEARMTSSLGRRHSTRGN